MGVVKKRKVQKPFKNVEICIEKIKKEYAKLKLRLEQKRISESNKG